MRQGARRPASASSPGAIIGSAIKRRRAHFAAPARERRYRSSRRRLLRPARRPCSGAAASTRRAVRFEEQTSCWYARCAALMRGMMLQTMKAWCTSEVEGFALGWSAAWTCQRYYIDRARRAKSAEMASVLAAGVFGFRDSSE